MTIKKNYAREHDDVRRPKNRDTNNTRQDARIKHALRHGDLDALHDDELGEMGFVYEDEEE